ncbi:hypothetical protein [Maridesulfovibrio sp.]|uniref:hypothetical protein n=1 Tax=Maridesulfovibrio sp. TaxID=2795000 RepID=UPI002AA8F211|nr:hypothetical protein [Maridesulfovibrio sp.]
MSSKKAKTAEPATSPVGRKIRHCVFELRCMAQGMDEDKFTTMKSIIRELEGCALHIEEIEEHTPVSSFKPPLDAKQLAEELAASTRA